LSLAAVVLLELSPNPSCFLHTFTLTYHHQKALPAIINSCVAMAMHQSNPPSFLHTSTLAHCDDYSGAPEHKLAQHRL
jgi:hypothetical protein